MIFIANYILLQRDIQPFAEYAVAPHVGAWIETRGYGDNQEVPRVAPHVGAWIENNYSSVKCVDAYRVERIALT